MTPRRRTPAQPRKCGRPYCVICYYPTTSTVRVGPPIRGRVPDNRGDVVRKRRLAAVLEARDDG